MAFAKVKTSSAARGYGAPHRAARTVRLNVLAAAGVGRCCIGHEAIVAEQINLPRFHPRALVLDHCPCRTGCGLCAWTGYRGLACWQHNASDGATRGNYRRQGRVAPSVVTERRL